MNTVSISIFIPISMSIYIYIHGYFNIIAKTSLDLNKIDCSWNLSTSRRDGILE